ncbi:MAG: hypothetical protein DCC71_21465 [Proteobacteria bacterium]|nr:MAG: hypothetical protein DCC71_21465 [Pseudomonadota bacterium]
MLAFASAAPFAAADVRRTEEEIEVPPYATAPPCEDPGDRPVIATVVAVTGEPTRALPECEPSPLGCGSTIHAGDQIVTGPGAHVALESADRYVQIGPDAKVITRATSDGAPDLAVEQGAVRVIATSAIGTDAASAAVARVATPQLRTDAAGADTIASAGAAGGSAICSYAGPVAVVPIGGGPVRIAGRAEDPDGTPDVAAGPATLAANDCVVAGGGASAAAAPDAPVVSIADVGSCDLAGEFEPTDVALGPTGPGFPFAPPPPIPPPYCEAGSCGPRRTTPGPPTRAGIPLVESPAGYEPPP